MDYEIIIFFTVIFICGGIFGLLGIAALILACFKKDLMLVSFVG